MSRPRLRRRSFALRKLRKTRARTMQRENLTMKKMRVRHRKLWRTGVRCLRVLKRRLDGRLVTRGRQIS